MFRLSPNNNIGESYKRFGIDDSTTNIVAVKLNVRADGSVDEGVTRESVAKHLGEVIDGESVKIDDGSEGGEVGSACDVAKVRKVYKLADMKKGEKHRVGVVNGKGSQNENRDAAEDDEKRRMESVVLGIIALKGT